MRSKKKKGAVDLMHPAQYGTYLPNMPGDTFVTLTNEDSGSNLVCDDEVTVDERQVIWNTVLAKSDRFYRDVMNNINKDLLASVTKP